MEFYACLWICIDWYLWFIKDLFWDWFMGFTNFSGCLLMYMPKSEKQCFMRIFWGMIWSSTKYLNMFPQNLTCFIRGSNRLAGMDGTLVVAPRHAYDTKFASWLVSHSFAATTLRRLRGGSVEKKGLFVRENTGSGQTSGSVRTCCYHKVVCWLLDVKDISKRKQGEAHRNEVVMKCRDLEVSYLQNIHLNRIFHYKL